MAAVQAADETKRAAAHAKNDLESYIISTRGGLKASIEPCNSVDGHAGLKPGTSRTSSPPALVCSLSQGLIQYVLYLNYRN